MSIHMQLTLLTLAIICYKHGLIAQYVPPFSTTLVAPIAKHAESASKPLYSTQILTKYVYPDQYMHTNFLIDIEAAFTWYECIVLWTFSAGPDGGCPHDKICVAPVSCEEYQCTDVRTLDLRSSCPPVTNGSTDWGTCPCTVSVVNPINGSCGEALLNYDELRFHSTDGRTAVPDANNIFPNSACAPSSAFNSFPKDVRGVLALSNSSHALPAYLFYSYAKSFALCLPSTVSSTGVLFIGRDPYYLGSQSHSEVNVRSLLSYTPLLKSKSEDTFGYYIGVNTIVIKKRTININPPNDTTKISTTTPYITLRTNIYKQVIRRFSMVTKRFRQSKPIKPFGLCFKIDTNGTQTRLKVPNIDFGLTNGNKWSVSTSNSMMQVTKDVTCLAFVDGGATSEHAIVFGTFQMEDNFLLFDLVNSTFGFSSSLLSKGTSCSSFNFTSI